MRGGSWTRGRAEELAVDGLDTAHFFVRERSELVLTSSLRELPITLAEKRAQSLDLSIWHLDNLFHRG